MLEDTLLRCVQTEDANRLRDWLEDPIVCHYTIGHYPFIQEDFQKWWDAEDQFGWVLETENGVIGYGEVWVDEQAKDVELAHIIINPQFRSQGYGKRLTQLLYQKACEFGFSSIYMRVYPDNKQALACYESVGFKRVEMPSENMSNEWIWLQRPSNTASPAFNKR